MKWSKKGKQYFICMEG